MRESIAPRWAVLLPAAVISLSLIGCSGGEDPVDANQIFVDCLERNGVAAEDVEVTVDSDGKVTGISAGIISEGDVAYEPTVRLACTEEVEANY